RGGAGGAAGGEDALSGPRQRLRRDALPSPGEGAVFFAVELNAPDDRVAARRRAPALRGGRGSHGGLLRARRPSPSAGGRGRGGGWAPRARGRPRGLHLPLG